MIAQKSFLSFYHKEIASNILRDISFRLKTCHPIREGGRFPLLFGGVLTKRFHIKSLLQQHISGSVHNCFLSFKKNLFFTMNAAEKRRPLSDFSRKLLKNARVHYALKRIAGIFLFYFFTTTTGEKFARMCQMKVGSHPE